MQRVLDVITQRSFEKEASPDANICLVTITHSGLDEIIRLAGDGADWLFEGQTYDKGGFDLTLVSDDDKPPVARFSFPNVNRPLTARIEVMTEPAEVMFQIVSSAYFNLSAEPRVAKAGMSPIAFYTAKHLQLIDVEATAEIVSGTLRIRDFRQEIYPSRRATPDITPGVWE